MTRRTKIIAAVLATLTAGAAFACSHHHNTPHGERAKRFVSHKVDRVMSRIDATEQQATRIRGIKDKLFVEYEKAHAGSRDTKRAFLSEWKSEKPDAEKLHRLADERVAKYQKAIHETIDGMVEAHATLNPEQRAEISEHIEKRMRD